MRNFKRFLLPVVVIVVFLVMLDKGARFVYQDPGNLIIYSKNDLKKSKGEVETLLLGTSLVHWGINGQMLGDALESTTFNLATAAQPLSGSYYLLKDQIKYNDIKKVFLGVHVSTMTRDYGMGIKIRESIFERLLSPLGKLEYLYKTADCAEYPRYLFFLARQDNLFDYEQVEKNVTYKRTDDFKNNISPPKKKYVYQTMGNDNTRAVYKGNYAQKRLPKKSVWNRENIIDYNEEYLQMIADLCRENEIELNLVIMPMVPEITKLLGDIGDMHEYYADFCSRNNATLFDFNRYENIYGILPNEYFQDAKHLNVKGANVFTGLLTDWYLNGGRDTDGD